MTGERSEAVEPAVDALGAGLGPAPEDETHRRHRQWAVTALLAVAADRPGLVADAVDGVSPSTLTGDPERAGRKLSAAAGVEYLASEATAGLDDGPATTERTDDPGGE